MFSASPDSDVLVRVENVSKKFCRSLKKSLWYGVTDVASALNPFSSNNEEAHGTKHKAQSTNTIPLRPDEFWAVQNVSFELRRGECLGLIGHNGAGKSTLLKVLNGLIPPDTGSITMRGRVCALIELNAGFNPILSGRENIFNQAALLGFTKEETLAKFDAIVEFAEIGDFIDMPVQNYSSGMKVRLGFGVAAQMEPDVLIVDEVLAVGDINFRMKCLKVMAGILSNSAVIFVSHSMPQVFRVATTGIVLNKGRIELASNRIGECVDRYLQISKPETSRNIAGNGLVDLLECCIQSEDGICKSETSTIQRGKPFKIITTLKLNAKHEGLHLQYVVWNAEMIPVIDIISENNKGFILPPSQDGTLKVTTDIDSNSFGCGRHSLTLIVYSKDMSEPYLTVENIASLQVSTHFPTGCATLMKADWRAELE